MLFELSDRELEAAAKEVVQLEAVPFTDEESLADVLTQHLEAKGVEGTEGTKAQQRIYWAALRVFRETRLWSAAPGQRAAALDDAETMIARFARIQTDFRRNQKLLEDADEVDNDAEFFGRLADAAVSATEAIQRFYDLAAFGEKE